jgi:uncharacterized repeat protein (TIGR01451 family)
VISEGYYELLTEAECYQAQAAQVNVISGTVITQDFFLDPKTDLSSSDKTVSAGHALPGDALEFQVHVRNNCSQTSVLVTDTLPSQLTWTGYVTATSGDADFEAGQILWQGEIEQAEAITITYGVSLNQCLQAETSIFNLAEISDRENTPITRTVMVNVDNAVPAIPQAPNPPDLAENQPLTTTLTWAPSTDLNCDPVTYTIYFGSDNPPKSHFELTTPSFDPGGLELDTTYYWYIIASDGQSRKVGPLWRFSTIPEAPVELNRIFMPLASK